MIYICFVFPHKYSNLTNLEELKDVLILIMTDSNFVFIIKPVTIFTNEKKLYR